ncbi:MAG: hypothetical protein JSR46_09135, partial [Verrucomicrobia bacterium]|nr:hypothetical protein [Verrucomicrobiota bacterium]
GIHKNKQSQSSHEATRELYQDMKLRVLKNMNIESDTEVVQVVGGCSAYSPEGTARAKEILKALLSQNCVILYGYTGMKEQNGAMCDVNAAVSDVAGDMRRLDRVVANVVGFDTPRALNEWKSSGPQLKNFVIVYGDDESCEGAGTLFGDDVTTSDFFADKMVMLDGGVQSFRQACNALLLNQKITAMTGLRAEDKKYVSEISAHSQDIVRTPFFAAVQFLSEVAEALLERKDRDPDEHLKEWFKQYFGKGKCYVCDPKKKTFDTKQRQLEEAWDLFLNEKLYLKMDKLITFQN